MQPIIEGGDVVEPLRERILGRVAAVDIPRPGSDDVICEGGTLLDEAWVDPARRGGCRPGGGALTDNLQDPPRYLRQMLWA